MARHEEVERRIDAIMALESQGCTYNQLVRAAVSQWNVTERHAKRYIRKARELAKSLAVMSYEEFLASWLIKNHFLYTKAIQSDDLELARRLKADEARTFKAFIQGGKTNEPMADSTQTQPEEMAALIAKLTADWPEV